MAGSAVVPMVRWRTWRYEVRPEELDLLRGVLVVTRTLIPMARVQHVEHRHGLGHHPRHVGAREDQQVLAVAPHTRGEVVEQ